jgi:hypothetical protein
MILTASSEYVPNIKLDDTNGEVWITGESYHEYTQEVFQPVFKWFEDYTQKTGKKLTLNFKMNYFNTSSARIFLELMRIAENYAQKKKGKVQVNWYYEEEDMDMLDSGEKYKQDVKIPFNLILST